MPIVNVSNHFIEDNGNPVDPDKLQVKNRKDNKNNNKKK